MDQAVHKMAIQQRAKSRTAIQKVTGYRNGRNYLEQDSIGQTTVDGTDGGLHPAADGQRQGDK